MTPVPAPRDVALAVLDRMAARNFAGWDPFDGLNSRVFHAVGLDRIRLARLAWLQFHKRSPINFRPLVGVPRVRNAKGLGVTILGLLELPGSDVERARWRVQAVGLGEWLLANACEDRRWGGLCWGYPFDWQARAFYVARGTPNVITTVYVALALHRLADATGDARFADAAASAARAIDHTFHAVDAAGPYYRYIPGDPTFVHNASLWAAAVVAIEAARSGDAALRSRALAVARRSAALQEPDGSWRYGSRPHHAFKDSFHTGYNVEALQRLSRALCVTEFDSGIARGLEHFRRDFVLPDGTVKYYHDRPYPLDTHCFAQAIVTLVKVAGSPRDLAIARRIAERLTVLHYERQRARFAYQSGAWVKNRVEYVRWTQAWAFYALAVAAAADVAVSGDLAT